MNSAGVLLDAGPLVALLSRHDGEHDRAKKLFATCEPPFRTCEAVVAEACFLMRTVDPEGPAEVLAHRKQRVSLADACLIRCAELHEEPRILTFDSDFAAWDRPIAPATPGWVATSP